MSIRVLIVEDNAALRAEIAALVERTRDLSLVGKADSLKRARGIATQGTCWDVALVDIGLPDGSGIDLVREWHLQFPERHSLICTVFEDRSHVLMAITAGASGYLVKPPTSQLTVQIRQITEGASPLSPVIAAAVLDVVRSQQMDTAGPQNLGLTPTEIGVLRALRDGGSYAAVAERLGIAHGTVQTHIRSIYRKLQVDNAVRAVVRAINLGII